MENKSGKGEKKKGLQNIKSKIFDLRNAQGFEEIHHLLEASDEEDEDVKDEDFDVKSYIDSEDGVDECEAGSETEQQESEKDYIEETADFYLGQSQTTTLQ
ncbi:uncharacterized protein LOC118187695 [Stegodyphus dumicola]|uniref:uncharacterized protein LOC118187695 n=1 Tax=Stegodyphus dumicola TaxID=202533 RepID=UPI0015A7B4A9|nr:uncharacterized protein LOC118187695 [Stegodyphus dumicola]